MATTLASGGSVSEDPLQCGSLEAQSLRLEDPLEKSMAVPPVFLPWKYPRTEEPGMTTVRKFGKVGHSWETGTQLIEVLANISGIQLLLLWVNLKLVSGSVLRQQPTRLMCHKFSGKKHELVCPFPSPNARKVKSEEWGGINLCRLWQPIGSAQPTSPLSWCFQKYSGIIHHAKSVTYFCNLDTKLPIPVFCFNSERFLFTLLPFKCICL